MTKKQDASASHNVPSPTPSSRANQHTGENYLESVQVYKIILSNDFILTVFVRVR